MVIQNNYDGPPSLEIYQEFVRVPSTASNSQNVVVVAQHYDVYSHEQATEWDEFVAGTAYAKSWTPGLRVDMATVQPYFRNAACAHTTVTGTDTGSGTVSITGVNGLKFSKEITSFIEPVNIGDTIRVQYTDSTSKAQDVVAEVLSTSKSTTQGTATEVTLFSGTSTGTMQRSGTYAGNVDRTYYLKVDSSTLDGSIIVVTFLVTTSDGMESGKITLRGKNTVAVISSGISVKLNDDDDDDDATKYVVGDYFKFDVTAGLVGKLTDVYLNRSLPNYTGATDLKVSLCKNKDFALSPTMFNVDASGVTIDANAHQTVEFGVGATTEVDADIVKADLFVEYRAINAKYSRTIGSVAPSDSITEVLGDTTVKNPLGAMVKAALKGGKTVYFVSVASDTVAEYSRAFTLISKSALAYGVVIQSTDQAVISEALNFVNQCSAPAVANYKILYYGLDANPRKLVMKRTAADKAYQATVSAGTVTLSNIGESFIAAGVREGDEFRINYQLNADGTVSHSSYTVMAVTSDTTLVLSDGTVTVDVPKDFQVWRELEGTELVEELASRQITNDHRAVCVFGDGINVDVNVDAPAWLMAALPAGMRAGEACQRPISNMVYSGCTAEPKLLLGAGDMRELASHGVWILASSADGSEVYNYHQLTTDMSDKKLQEQSYTTNFDNISIGARALLSPFYGNSNISQDFIDQIRLNVWAYLNKLKGNAPSVNVGPQLIDFSNLTLVQDEVNKDHVYMDVDYEMPAPFNHVTFRQRLI